MHLADRRGGQGIWIEGVEQLFGRSPQLFAERALHLGIRKGRDAIEQAEQRVAVFEREDVGLQRQHLTKLDEAAPHVFERGAEAYGSRQRPDGAPPGQTGKPLQRHLHAVCDEVAPSHHEHLQQTRERRRVAPHTGRPVKTEP